MKQKPTKTKEVRPKTDSDTMLMKIKYGTRGRLGEIGKFGESLDDVINRLIDFYNEHHNT